MNYGLAYGLSVYGLSQQLRVPADEARGYMDEYFSVFGGVRDYLRAVVAQARQDGYTETILGRRRYLPDLTSDNRQRREMAERMALNAPIQGSAADIIKVAMLRVDEEIRRSGLRSRMLLQVHDELLFEVAPGELGQLSDAGQVGDVRRVHDDRAARSVHGHRPELGRCGALTAVAGSGPAGRDPCGRPRPRVPAIDPLPTLSYADRCVVISCSPPCSGSPRAVLGRAGVLTRHSSQHVGKSPHRVQTQTLSVSGAHLHMTTSSTQATSTPQVAVNDIGSEEAFLAAIDETIKYFNDGDIVDGTVVKVDRDEVLLDIGYKTEGVIPSRELSIKHDVDPNDVVKTGDHIEALVLQKEDKEGRLILSKKRAQYERAWGTIEKIKDEDGVVTGTVIEVVKGGLILDIGLRGFLPASLVEMRRVRDLQPYVGKEIEAKIIELDKNRNNVVLSRRAWLEQTQSEVRQNFLNTLQKGQIRKGVVSSIVNFGAFVDLGGVDGLVHVSELSWKHIDHPGEVVEVGQDVTVEVLDVDMDRERVSLSLKSTQEDPWQQFARMHQIGQVVPGRVTKLVPFGAFVRVEEGIEGLVHISELADRHVEIPEQVVQVGDEIFVKIIDIDLDRRRISLSLKQANEGAAGEVSGEDFDPTLYGMPATYDEQGNYVYPDGFDPESGEWLEGFDAQREEWERQYAEARARFEAHQRQVAEARSKAEGEEGEDAAGGAVAHLGIA